jgi:hypothetical protein
MKVEAVFCIVYPDPFRLLRGDFFIRIRRLKPTAKGNVTGRY